MTSSETPIAQPHVDLEYANGQTIAPVESQDDRMLRLRSAYSSAFDNVMDRVLEEVLLPDDKAALCLDAAQFFTYLMTVKVVEAHGLALTRENLMAKYWPFQKALKDDVPGMLRELAARAANQEAMG
jgi:hypothetical protein